MEKEKKLLEKLLKEAVKKNLGEAILFSGGIDSSTLAYFGIKNNPDLLAINVKLERHKGEDEQYARNIVKKLGIRNFLVSTIKESEIDYLLKTFILSLGNFNVYWASAGIVLCKGILEAKKQGLNSVMTGEGSDDLFGSFPVMLNWKYSKEELKKFIKTRIKDIDLMTKELGIAMGVNIFLPFYYPPLVNFVLNLPIELKIKKTNKGKITKYLLRETMKKLLPKEVIERPQTMAFTGVPTLLYLTKKYNIFSENEIKRARNKYGINFQSSFEYYNFKILNENKKYFPNWKNNFSCLYCGSKLRSKNSVYCKVCGSLQYKGKILPF